MVNTKDIVAIRFIRDEDEPIIPEIRISRNEDGRTGQAIFIFKNPTTIISVNSDNIKAMYLVDEEGEITIKNINVKIVRENKVVIEAVYKWENQADMIRFLRFANRYNMKNTNVFKENIKR